MEIKRPVDIESTFASKYLPALMFAAVGILVYYPIHNFDFFWHLAMGREMLAQGRIINEEIFSFTMAGKEFSNHEWLSEIIFYKLYDLTGPTGLVLFKVAIALLLAGIMYKSTRRLGAASAVAAVVIIMGFVVGKGRFTIRPQLFSLLFLGGLAYMLHSYACGKLSKKQLLAVPVLMLVWDCFHGSVYGFGFLCTFFAGESVKRFSASFGSRINVLAWLGQGALNGDRYKWLVKIFGGTVVAMLISPIGLRAYDIFLDFARKDSYGNIVHEFQPVTFNLAHLAYLLMLALVLLLIIVGRKKINLTHVFLVLAFGVLSFRYNRAGGAFAVVAAPLMGLMLSDLLRRVQGRKLYYIFLMILLVPVIGYIVIWKFVMPEHRESFGSHVYEKYLPVAAARFIKGTDLQGQAFHRGKFGSYFAYELYPERKIFMYNHHYVFNEMPDLIHSGHYLTKYDIDYAVVNDSVILGIFLGRGWVPVFWEPSSAILINDNGKNTQVINKYRLKHYMPLTQFEDFRRKALAGVTGLARELGQMLEYREDHRLAGLLATLVTTQRTTRQEALELVSLGLKGNPESASLYAAEGSLHLSGGAAVKAEASLKQALAYEPGNPMANAAYAFVLLDRGEAEKAEAYFKRSMAGQADLNNAYYGLGLAYIKMGRNADALNSLREFIKREPYGAWSVRAREMVSKLESGR